MNLGWSIPIAVCFAAIVPLGVSAETVTVDSAVAGSFYACPTCNQSFNQMEVTVGSNTHGAYSFPFEGHGPIITEATLVLQSSLLSTDNAKINVYGYDGGGATSFLDAPGATFIGVWTLYDRVEPIRSFLFDVTDFVSQVQTEAVGFRLQPISGFNSFKMLGKLVVTSVPEPNLISMLAVIAAPSLILRRRSSIETRSHRSRK
jgi:hypothetical protein